MNQDLGSFMTEKSIAVLPFSNLSADDDNEYFCDGLTEEIINALSKISGLKVTARSSTFTFKGGTAQFQHGQTQRRTRE